MKLDHLLHRESWVMDGNYTSSLEYRLSFADTAIFIDENRYVYLWRCFKRLVQNRGHYREELPPGCYEKMGWNFFQWIHNYPRNQKSYILEQFAKKSNTINVHILQRSKEVIKF